MIGPRLIFVMTLLFVALTHGSVTIGDTYAIPWYSIDAGGGPATGDVYRLDASIGQPDAGPAMTGGAFALTGGYWTSGCPADVDGNAMVDFQDLVAVLTAWGECGGCPEDINGDGDVNVLDLILVLTTWGPC